MKLNWKNTQVRMTRFITLSIICLLSIHTYGQDSRLGAWYIYFGDIKLKEKFHLHYEAQYRSYDMIGDLEQLLLRTGIGYDINEHHQVLLGYGNITAENYTGYFDEKARTNENRFFQQYIGKHTHGRFSFVHRVRFEQRFFKNDFLTRFRYFLAPKIAINNPSFDDNTLYLSLYNEIFIGGREDYQFNINRVYGGLGYKVNSKLKLELGYMTQIFRLSSRDQLNLICSLSI